MIIIYGKDSCGWCLKAKKYCEDNNIDYEYITIKTKKQAREISIKYNMSSIPIIIENDTLIGGWSDFIYHLKTNL